VAVDGASQAPQFASGNIMGANPGTVTEESRRKSLVLAGLGDIHSEEVAPQIAIGADNQGEGDRVVVLVDYVSGPNGEGFMRGNVRHLSRFFGNWGKEDELDNVRRGARRLFELEAIRLTTPEEAIMSQVTVTPASETTDVQKERDARIRAERELDLMRERVRVAEGAQAAASPTPSGGPVGHEKQGSGTANTNKDDDSPEF